MKSRSETKEKVVATPEYQKFEQEMDRKIQWPPISMVYIAMFGLVVACLMIFQSAWLEPRAWYAKQLLGGWACFFMSFYMINRFDTLQKRALHRLRDLISVDLKAMESFTNNIETEVSNAFADVVYLAEHERRNPSGTERLN